jgi:hypothetical protein
MADNWGTAKTKAGKVLGKDGKIPEPKSLDKLRDDWWTAFAGYEKSRDDMEAKILALQKAGASVKLSLKQFEDQLDDEDFGLDEKNKDDQKKIKEAHDILAGWVEHVTTNVDADIDSLDELDKHVIDFKKYKPKQTNP